MTSYAANSGIMRTLLIFFVAVCKQHKFAWKSQNYFMLSLLICLKDKIFRLVFRSSAAPPLSSLTSSRRHEPEHRSAT